MKNFKFITVLPEAYASIVPNLPNHAMISITEPGRDCMFHDDWENGNLLRVQFHDISKELDNTEHKGTVLRCITEEQAEQIIDFVESLPQEVNHLIVHCAAGISRSPAVGEFIRQYFTNLPKISCPIDLMNRDVYSTLCRVINKRIYKDELCQ